MGILYNSFVWIKLYHYVLNRFSRKVIWLQLASTNNDPSVVAKYYLDAVLKLEGKHAVMSCMYKLFDVILLSHPPEMNLMLVSVGHGIYLQHCANAFSVHQSQATQHELMSTELSDCVCGTVVDMRMVSVLCGKPCDLHV